MPSPSFVDTRSPALAYATKPNIKRDDTASNVAALTTLAAVTDEVQTQPSSSGHSRTGDVITSTKVIARAL